MSHLDFESWDKEASYIGVCLSDNRNPPRYFRLLTIPARMGIGYFEPLDDKGATIPIPLKDFWALVKL